MVESRRASPRTWEPPPGSRWRGCRRRPASPRPSSAPAPSRSSTTTSARWTSGSPPGGRQTRCGQQADAQLPRGVRHLRSLDRLQRNEHPRRRLPAVREHAEERRRAVLIGRGSDEDETSAPSLRLRAEDDGPRSDGQPQLDGTVAVVTGGYAGVGLETTRALAAAGASVVVPARTVDKARAALSAIERVEIESLDLGESGLDRCVRRAVLGVRPPAAPARQQRGRHGDASRARCARVRVAARDQSPGALPTHREALARAEAGARGACRGAVVTGPCPRCVRLRRSEVRATPVRQVDRLRSVQDGKRALRPRARHTRRRSRCSCLLGPPWSGAYRADTMDAGGGVAGNTHPERFRGRLYKTTEQGAATSVWCATSRSSAAWEASTARTATSPNPCPPIPRDWAA